MKICSPSFLAQHLAQLRAADGEGQGDGGWTNVRILRGESLWQQGFLLLFFSFSGASLAFQWEHDMFQWNFLG